MYHNEWNVNIYCLMQQMNIFQMTNIFQMSNVW